MENKKFLISTIIGAIFALSTFFLGFSNYELQKDVNLKKFKSEYLPQLRFNGLKEVKNGDSVNYVVKLKNHSDFSIYLYKGTTKVQIDNQPYSELFENIKKSNPIEVLKDSIVSIKVFSEKEKKFGYKIKFDYEYYSAKDRESIFSDSIPIFDRSPVALRINVIDVPIKMQSVTINFPWGPPIDTLRRYQSIIKNLELKLEFDKKNSQNYYDLASAYLRINEVEKAKINYIKCSELDPKNYSAPFVIAKILFADEKYEEAQKWIAKSLQANSEYIESYILLGCMIYNNAANNSKSNFEKAYNLAPTEKRLIEFNKFGDKLIEKKFKFK